jgi:integrase
LTKKISFHNLPHSFSTHLLKHGEDLRYIQKLLFHKNSKTTKIYSHFSRSAMDRIISPLDGLDLNDEYICIIIKKVVDTPDLDAYTTF